MPRDPAECPAVPSFDRRFLDGAETFTRVGSGSIGGKAHGLLSIKGILASRLESREGAAFDVRVPTLSVIATDLFDAFMERNGLWDVALPGRPDDRIALAFQQADLPAELVGDLRALIEQVHTPLAVRSSSRLEDAMYRPFAGVYATKMIPNNQPDADTRFRRLVEAVKFVYASTFFAGARGYREAAGVSDRQEKMAVIVQEVVGRRHGDRYYPELSGVARSYSFYRSGKARPEDGVVNLALGLGKTIVDGGLSWSYSPAYPRATPPYGSVRDLLKLTQLEFWAVNMGKPPAYNPIEETEYMVRAGIPEAEYDGTLREVASTYLPQSDRLSPGIGASGPRVVNFAPLLVLEEFPFNDLIRKLLSVCTEAVGAAVEIEFAVTFPPRDEPARFGFLQVRPMVISAEEVDVDLEQAGAGVLLASDRVMGNGVVEDVNDVVFVKPDVFEARHTPAVAQQLATLNRGLVTEQRPYLLIGFGRWGSSDPWLGIPVTWDQIAGAKAIVEATLPSMNVELSQGSHFFHNISSFGVSYFSVPFSGEHPIDWDGLARQKVIRDLALVRHVRVDSPLLIKVDGRSGRGLISWGRS
jgi:Pyruvate phosphate dikinase, AMP/ATP-binding domain